MSNETVVAAVPSVERTRWAYVALLLAAGVGAAMQVGKVPPSLPILQRELHISLLSAAWIISLFSVMGATLGCLAGSVADYFGPRRAAALGLACMAAAGWLGAHADGVTGVLFSRALEGMAFVLVVVAIPSLIFASARPADRRFVPALWGTYMPIGMSISLAIAPAVIKAWDWRGLWQLNAALLLLLAVALASLNVPAPPPAAKRAPTPRALGRVILRRGPLLLGLIFTCYTFQHMSVMGFLPTILQQQGFAAQSAGTLTAIAVLANAVGNLSASALIARGVRPSRLIMIACASMAVTAIGVFSLPFAPLARYEWVVVFSLLAGLVPASIFACVPAAAEDRRASATIMGFVVQCSHIGQLIGPPAVAAVAAAAGGWQLSTLVLVPAACIALVTARQLHRLHIA